MHERISTGCEPLDKMLGGGLFESRPYLVSGEPSTGKTLLSLRFLLEGLKNGEDVLFVTIDETPEELRSFVAPLGWSLKDMAILDAFPEVRSYRRASDIQEVASFGGIKVMREIKPAGDDASREEEKGPAFKPVELSIQALQMTLKKAFEKRGYDRIVIDSLTSLRLFGMMEEDSYVGIQSLLRLLSEMETTALITMNPPDEPVILPERFITRGEIRLLKVRYQGYTRAIRIERFRGSAHDNLTHPFRITGRGIEIDLKAIVPVREDGYMETAPGPPRPKRVEADAHAHSPSGRRTAPLQAKGKTSRRPRLRAKEMLGDISALDEMVRECISIGIDVREPRILLSKAKVHLHAKRLERAFECIQRCEEMLNQRMEEYETFVSTVM